MRSAKTTKWVQIFTLIPYTLVPIGLIFFFIIAPIYSPIAQGNLLSYGPAALITIIGMMATWAAILVPEIKWLQRPLLAILLATSAIIMLVIMTADTLNLARFYPSIVPQHDQVINLEGMTISGLPSDYSLLYERAWNLISLLPLFAIVLYKSYRLIYILSHSKETK